MVASRLPRVRVVVLNHNGGEDVVRCVEAILALDWPASALDVVVVDNASTDGSADELARRFPEAEIRRSPRNVGFAGNNLALLDLEDVDHVGLVNNDAFVDPGYLRPLVEALEADPSLGAACPKILLADRYVVEEVAISKGARLDEPEAVALEGWERPDDLLDPRPFATGDHATVLRPVGTADRPLRIVPGTAERVAVGEPVDVVNNVGTVLTDRWYGADRGLHDVDDGRYDTPEDVFAWSGGAVLLRRAYIEAVGGFDPALFLYYEDLDLAWKGRAAGWRYRTVPTAVVRHRLAASTTVGSTLFRYQTERNRLVVLTIHAPTGVVLRTVSRFLLSTASYARRDVLGRLVARQRPTTALVRLRLRSFGGFLRLLPHALRRRRQPTVTTPGSSRASSSQSPTTGT